MVSTNSIAKPIYSGILILTTIVFIPSRAQDTDNHNKSELSILTGARQFLNPNHLNFNLLEQTLIYFTNKARRHYRLKPFSKENKLQNAARLHSLEMASLNYFSHESPVSKNRKLSDRLKNTGLSLSNTIMGENIGFDYFLKIANVPHYKKYYKGKWVYIHHKTGEPIGYQTYQEFASQMVIKWMKSPGHRKNILNRKFDRIGIGIAVGIINEFHAIYVTQNLLGSLDEKQTTRVLKK